jgi:hypothetical protein
MACTPDMTFEDCELAILRENVDKAEKEQGKKLLHSPDTQAIIKIVESFIHNHGLIIYGGTAINNILPTNDRFYDYSYQLPDYDVYSPDAVGDAKKLADLFAKKFNKQEDVVEAKSGVHYGTYKVYVNNLAVADITFLHPDLFKSLKKDIIRKQGLLVKKDLLYAPANFLRQSMYLELSRPKGDISRWEKVLKRLTLLNKHYPLKIKKCKINIQRKMSDMSAQDEKKIFNIVKQCFVQEKVIFIGGYANALYSKYSPLNIVKSLPDFDVLSTQPMKTCENIKLKLEKEGFKCYIKTYPAIGELIEEHYSIQIDEDYIAFVYKPNACHSFNEVTIDGDKIKVGTIDTLLSFYMAFMYADRDYYDINRLVCLSTMLFNVQQHNRLKQSGLLQRFNINCYGEQKTLSDIRDEKLKMRTELNPNSEEYEKWFLNYNPLPKTSKKKVSNKKTKKKLNKKK